jgi:hypothetical protein
VKGGTRRAQRYAANAAKYKFCFPAVFAALAAYRCVRCVPFLASEKLSLCIEIHFLLIINVNHSIFPLLPNFTTKA